MPSHRLFIALDTPPDVKQEMGELCQKLASSDADVRWERTGRLHCTLQFLGEVDDEMVNPLGAAVHKALEGIVPFLISYRGIGFFPEGLHPRVVWAGIEDHAGRLAYLHKRILEETARLGLIGNGSPFRAHVTLGRVRGPGNLRRLTTMTETCTFEHPPVTVREVVIMKSELKYSGSVYTVLRSIPLTS